MGGDAGWVDAALNGASTRIPSWFRPAKAGDTWAGGIRERTENTLTISIEYGIEDGEPIGEGEWKRIDLRRYRILAAWDRRDQPAVGERVAVRYLGKCGPNGWRHDFAAGVHRAVEPEPAAPWE